MADGGRRQSREQAKIGAARTWSRGADMEQGGGCGARADPNGRSAAATWAGESGGGCTGRGTGGVPSGSYAGRRGRHGRAAARSQPEQGGRWG
jgi:hypothetical protein